MGNSLNCASGNSAGRSSSKYKSNMTEKKDCKFVTEIPGDDTLERTVAPDVLPIEAAHMARQRRFSRRSLNESNPSSPKPTNNNDKPEVFTFETAFRMSQLHSNSPPMVTIPITPSPIAASSCSPITATSSSPITATISDQPSTRNSKDSCYVNIKPFMFPLPPLPPDMPPNSEDGSHSFVSVSSAEVIPQEEVTPPTFRRNSSRAHCLEESFNMESPKLPPKPSHLSLPRNISPEQIADNSSIESAAKSPPPRKVVFTDLGLNSEGCSLPPADPCCKSQAMEPQVSTSVVKKGPKKPPRNYSYKASTLPKRISHTTEEVMELWDEVRKALSLEKIGDTTSVHISEEEEDADDLYQNLYAARMRSWQIMCLSQDVLVDRLKPDRVWECFLNESLVNEAEMEVLNLSQCSQRESSQLIVDRILEHGDGWFDRLREILRVHEDQRLISNLLETLNDVFIIGAKANKWNFSLTTKHCTVQQHRPRVLLDQPDLIGDTLDGMQPILLLEVYDENFGNSSCAALGEVLRKYNVISQLNLGKNRLSSKGIAKLVFGIEGNRCLEKLNLRLNLIENEGFDILAKAMERNGSIRELILCHTNLQTGAGAILSRLLTQNSSLEVLDLSYNDLSDEDCEAMIAGLHGNQTIRTLNLRGNQITDIGCRHLAVALKGNRSLQALDISHNDIGDEGVMHFCDILDNYDGLRELHMEQCGIHWEGAQSLARVLTNNHTLAALYLSNNAVGDDGCEALADMLVMNGTLQTLYLNLCSINRASLHRMLVVLSHDNFSLRTLAVCNNNIDIHNDELVQGGFEGVDMRNALNRALEYNTDRKILTWGKALS